MKKRILKSEEKELLLKDLCARLPHHCQVFYEYVDDLDNKTYGYSLTLNTWCIDEFDADKAVVKPYLRPLSSMTVEEREEVEVLIFGEWFAQDSGKVDSEGWIEILANYDVSGIDPGFCSDYVDWLVSHHFDFRGLIPAGLALKAKEGMYDY